MGLNYENACAMNAALCDFATRWKVDGDYLRCRVCNRPQLAGNANMAFQHSSTCMRHVPGDPPFEVHPWQAFVRILAPLYPTPAPETTEGE